MDDELGRIIDALPGLLWTTLPDGYADFLNRHWLEYTGLTAEQAIGWGWQAAVHPDDLPKLLERWLAIIASSRSGNAEARLRRFDGAYRWFHFQVNPMTDSSGQIVKWCGVNTDVEDWRAHEALRASERDLRQTVNTIPTLAWCNRNDGSNEFLNQRWHDYTGLSPEEANGWGWQVTIHPDDLPMLLDIWGRMLASGEPGELEARLRRFDGVYRWFLFRCDPLRDETGAVVKWYGTNTDIEDLKQAEQELRHSAAFLAQGEAVSETGSFLWRLEANEITCSAQFHRIFEFEQGFPITLEHLAGRVHPDDFRMLDEMAARARAGHNSEYEGRLLMPDGSIKYVHILAQASQDAEGRLECIGAVQNVTERRLQEQALSRVRSELAHVARVTSLNALTASIAHEVNQPLSGIITNASTCLRMLASDPPNVEGALETARRTIRDGNRASDVITRLRALFKKQAPAIEPVDLNAAASEVIALSMNELHRNEVALRMDFAEELPPVAGDRVQLQQVILNLILNASEAMGDLSHGSRQLIVRTEMNGQNKVVLSVCDSGPGLEPQNAAKVFEAFYTTKPGGMGIGLSVSRSIIESHQGRLWARANERTGATFGFSIPQIGFAAESAHSDHGRVGPD
ncbi:MAG TPA: PAS domain-containing protein [Rhizomicrobium sp.]|jgi:PAS domain S-box-containing protein